MEWWQHHSITLLRYYSNTLLIHRAMTPVTVACHAMATRFEIVLHGDNPASLRAAGEEALRLVEELDDQLSLFRPGSEIARLNARAACEPVRVTPGVFALLQHAQKLSEQTDGAFDITVAPLVRCWGFMGGEGRMPSPEEVAEARAKVGMHLVQLNPGDFTVRFAREGVMLDLGAIGKGYAIERAAEVLCEAGVTSALLHGGTSSVQAIGQPQERSAGRSPLKLLPPRTDAPPALLATVQLPRQGHVGLRRAGTFLSGRGRTLATSLTRAQASRHRARC